MTTAHRVVIGAAGGALIAAGAVLFVRALTERHCVATTTPRPTTPPPRETEPDSALDMALEATFPASDPVVAWSG